MAFFMIAVSLFVSIGAEAGSIRAALVRNSKVVIGFVLLGKLPSGGYGGLGRYRVAADRGEPVGARITACRRRGCSHGPGLLARLRCT
jgi:hypothetical protein